MMCSREEFVSSFYQQTDEDARLWKNRHGQLEYRITMTYIHRYAADRSRILELGAGTGRYSIALAKEGMDVTAVELVEKNLAVLRKNGKGLPNLHSFRGDAADLSRFPDNAFDVTLSLGPMYHLYEAEEVDRAIDEAIRVTKPGGVMLFLCEDHASASPPYMLPTRYSLATVRITQGPLPVRRSRGDGA